MSAQLSPATWDASPRDAQAWVRGLQRCFDGHAHTRMAGLPICHPGLLVQTVGFMPWPPAEAPEVLPRGQLGVLLTPWFMNLVWRADPDGPATPAQQAWLDLPVGASRRLDVISADLPFIGTHEPGLGHFAVCSLMSPLFHLADQDAAVAAAQAVMDTLSQQAQAVLKERQRQAAALAAQAAHEPSQPSRRGFLLGRKATGVDTP